MPRIRAEKSAVVDAPPQVVYAVIANYHDTHPQIIPPKYFFDLVVERGGTGAGTLIRFKVRLFGSTRETRAEIAEPQPGRVLTETYPENGAVTSFTVDAADGGRRSKVTIATEWETPGLRGVIERLLAPPTLRKVYVEELALLESVARGQAGASPAAGATGG